ncbi:pentapeptide repeat-containing protein [Pedobacter sp. Du54]|uniref:helix-turn-helix domain-containing protein n=1 Tax=Pedobacter anseongensis TaxID=3133439 RepID=UPI0030B4359C
MLNSKSIGNKIATARKKINSSQAELAQQISISPQAVGKWERGESMPDIVTLNRLAQILGVDLNYFSDDFPSNATLKGNEKPNLQALEIPEPKPKKKFNWNWDMSKANWVDADFSGLKNLKEKFSSSNMKNCKFLNSDLSALIIANNNIERCDFSSSNLRNTKIQSSNILNNQFNNCSFIDTEFSKNNIEKCNFSEVNFSGAELINSNFENNILKNAIWKFTSFKNTGIGNVTFEGILEDCHFENCTFYNVIFENATILNTFFKYNEKFKRVNFINCSVDKITYAFLQSNQANLTGITLLA